MKFLLYFCIVKREIGTLKSLILKITEKMKTNYKGYTINPNTKNNYALYAENVISGHESIRRYFATIKDALYYVNNISLTLNKLYCWRLVRVSDKKNFTTRIYK